MLKKVRSFLKCFIFADLGSFIGKSIAIYIDYRKHPGIYEMRSAPWYTEILARGLATGIIVLIVWIAYALIGRKIRKSEARQADSRGNAMYMRTRDEEVRFLKKLWQKESVICPKCNSGTLEHLHRKAKKSDCDWKCPSCGEIYRTIRMLKELPEA